MADKPKNFVWYELATTDQKAAEAFYAEVIGWNMRDAGMTGFAYTLLSVGEHMIGGLMALPPEAAAAGRRPSWIGHIGVDDVDEYASRVTAAGGSLHRPGTDIPGIGRFAVVADPQGAPFILFRADDPVPPPASPQRQGEVGWHELQAGELEPALAFYTGLFGWRKDHAMDMGPMGIYQIFAIDDAQMGGMLTKFPDAPAPFWLFYFNVDSIAAAVGRVSAAGGKVLREPNEVPGGSWIVHCLDPQGAMFALVGPHG